LWLCPARRKKERRVANSVLIIIDGKKHIATGCFEPQTGEAEKRLAAYIGEKYKPARYVRDIDQIDVADVLSVYLDDCGPRMADPPKLGRCIARLNDYWGGKKLSEVTTSSCRVFAQSRVKLGGTRTDLETLRAAINHHAKENLHHGSVRVALPPKGPPRDRWLTRREAAQLIRACWRYREKQTVHRGSKKGQKVETYKRPLRHLARFILIGLYTGTRASAIAAASPYRNVGHSFVDLEEGIFFRLATGKLQNNKRQSPAPIP
jgi:integrase